MKRIMILAAALMAVAACTKEQASTENRSFKAGQKVTLTLTAGAPESFDTDGTKVTSALNADGKTVNFTWAEGDKIKVTVNSSSADFTLVSGAGAASATFEGAMPASGSTFDIQYPATTPTLTTQAYSSTESVPHDMMLFKKTGCTLGSSSFSLAPQSAAIRLNLYGTSQTVSKIVVTNKSNSDTYTLNISPAVTLSTESTNPTPFFVVVPAGSYIFSAEIINAATGSGSSPATPPTDAIQNGVFTVGGTTNVFTTTSAKTLTAGQILNMNAKQVSVTLLTKVYFSKGNLYYDKTVSPAAFKFEDTQYAYTSSYNANHVCRFRWAEKTATLTDDINSAISTETSLSGSTSDVFFTNATQTTPRSDFTVADQTGVWRTLTSAEWTFLLNTRSGVTIGSTTGCRYAEVKVNSICGMLIFPDTFTWPSDVSSKPSTFNTKQSSWNSVDYTVDEFTSLQNAGCVFLPAAGSRNGSSPFDVGSSGHYWSSTPNGTYYAYFLNFYSGNVNPAYYSIRYDGHSVRLVSAAQ